MEAKLDEVEIDGGQAWWRSSSMEVEVDVYTAH